MKKILCLIESLNAGGAERQLTSLACMLKQKGNRVSVGTYDRRNFYKGVLEKNDVNYIVCSKSEMLFLRLIAILRLIIFEKPEVVISFSRASSIMACLGKAMCLHYKLIVSERNTTQILSKPEKVKFYLYRFADAIVPNSYSQNRFICNVYPEYSKKLKVITNFIDTELFKPNDKNRKDDGIFKILVVARVSEQKNTKSFIKAVAIVSQKITNFHVSWYGDQSNKSYFSSCIDLVSELHVDKYISFYRPTDTIAREYQISDIFCLPSIYEGYPNVICEAMSSSLPIICSNVCDNPNIVENDVNGYLFNPNDVNEIADTMLKAIRIDLDKRKLMGIKNREKMLNSCSADIFFKEYLNIIE